MHRHSGQEGWPARCIERELACAQQTEIMLCAGVWWLHLSEIWAIRAISLMQVGKSAGFACLINLLPNFSSVHCVFGIGRLSPDSAACLSSLKSPIAHQNHQPCGQHAVGKSTFRVRELSDHRYRGELSLYRSRPPHTDQDHPIRIRTTITDQDHPYRSGLPLQRNPKQRAGCRIGQAQGEKGSTGCRVQGAKERVACCETTHKGAGS